MSITKLVFSLTRLSICCTVRPTYKVLLNQTFRSISLSSCLSRKLDSRAFPPSKLPSSKNNRWVERKPFKELYEYTVEPLPFPRTGGRGPNGRIWNHRRGGGRPKVFYMIDWIRGDQQGGQSMVEKVINVKPDQNRSGHIALVASGEKKRYIVATENMKPDDLIKSSQLLTRSPVRPNEGDAYPLGSLPLGSLVNCVERFPGEGGIMARAAGVTAQLMRKQEDGMCVVRLPSKREVVVSANCMATVGRVSNVDHNKQKLGKAGAKRWLGIRPRSGRWHRKTGRFGRKIRRIRPAVVYKDHLPEKAKMSRFTLPNAPGVYESWRF